MNSAIPLLLTFILSSLTLPAHAQKRWDYTIDVFTLDCKTANECQFNHYANREANPTAHEGAIRCPKYDYSNIALGAEAKLRPVVWQVYGGKFQRNNCLNLIRDIKKSINAGVVSRLYLQGGNAATYDYLFVADRRFDPELKK